MANAANLELIITMTGMASGGTKIDDTVVTSALALKDIISLSTGFNAVSVPPGATHMTIYPPAANTNSLTLKGITGDTGIALSKTTLTCLSLDTGVTTVGLTTSPAGFTVEVTWT
jgi:hypothetical protein